jgi:hypothetical protein
MSYSASLDQESFQLVVFSLLCSDTRVLFFLLFVLGVGVLSVMVVHVMFRKIYHS